MKRFARDALYYLKKIPNLIWPFTCPMCMQVVEQNFLFCPSCWSNLSFIHPPLCIQCGLPMPYSGIDQCETCTLNTNQIKQHRSVFIYNYHIRRMVLGLKYGHQYRLSQYMGQLMAQSGRNMLEHADFLMPVPLHWTRFLKRGFNQAELLAFATLKHFQNTTPKTHLSLRNDLRRIHRTAHQGQKKREQRAKNVHNVFHLPHNTQHIFKNKHIVLIDDVRASGATLNACAACLINYGAERVDALTFAASDHYF